MKRDAIYPQGHLLTGTVYRVVKLIGAGGMGTVYEVEDTTVGKRYVLKTLHAELGGREDLAVRMEREARVLAKLAHPNIVEVVTAGVTRDDHNLRYFLMEKLDGFSLRPILRHTGPLGLNRFYTIGVHLFSALKHAHANDVVHRDVKPENIFLCRGGDGQHFAKLLDFGVFTSSAPNYTTQPGVRFVGTHKYAAPEQLKGRERVSGKTDVYAGGVVLYEMLAGHHPFDEAEGDIAVAAAHLHTEPAPIRTWRDLPPALAEIVHRCLGKNAELRPHAHEVADVLKGLKREWEATQPSDHSGRITARDEITQTNLATGGGTDNATEPDALVFAPGRSAREPASQLSIDPHAMTKSAPPSDKHDEQEKDVDPASIDAFLEGDANWSALRMEATGDVPPLGSDYGVAHSVDPNAVASRDVQRAPKRTPKWRGMAALAASVALLVGVTLLVRGARTPKERERAASAAPTASAPRPAEEAVPSASASASAVSDARDDAPLVVKAAPPKATAVAAPRATAAPTPAVTAPKRRRPGAGF